MGSWRRNWILTSASAALIVLAAAPLAFAALPEPRARFVVHDHDTVGDGWHIEMTVAKDNRFLRQLVLHSERCDETVLTARVRIRDDGTIASAKPFTTTKDAQGTWRLEAKWTDEDHVGGSFQITTPDCDGGVRTFSAHGEGHGGSGHSHVGFGTPIGSYPQMEGADRKAIAQTRRLWRQSIRQAGRRFSTYSRALALGFKPWARKSKWRPPMIFHVRHDGYERDRRTLDARRPESLVYWWPRRGSPVLVAFMYRAPYSGGWPAFGKPLLGWHAHGEDKPGATVMTHVWMTRNLRSAIANCMPVAELEAARSRFRFTAPTQRLNRESRPCPT